MTFTIRNDGKGRAFFEASGRLFRNSLKAANRRVAGIIKTGIEQSALSTFRNNSPGGLASSFRVEDVSDEGAEVRSDKVYAGIQDRGGVIRQRMAPYLHFRTEDGGWVRVKQVRIKPTKYIERGVESKREEIQAFVSDHLKVVQTKAAAAASRSRDSKGRFV